jgi:hypothetical protein
LSYDTQEKYQQSKQIIVEQKLGAKDIRSSRNFASQIVAKKEFAP